MLRGFSVSRGESLNIPQLCCGAPQLHLRGLFDERFDDSVECLRLFPVAEVAGLIDDVHFRFGIAVGDDFEECMAAFKLGGRIVVAPDNSVGCVSFPCIIQLRVSSLCRARWVKNWFLLSPSSSIFLTVAWYFSDLAMSSQVSSQFCVIC